MIDLRAALELTILRQMGIPSSFNAPNGMASREGLRQILEGLLKPIRDVIVKEHEAKGTPVEAIQFGPLFAGDIQAKARAVKTFIDAGITLEEAKRLSGLE